MRKIYTVIIISCLVITTPLYAKKIVISVLDFKNLGSKKYSHYCKGIAKTISSDLSSHSSITVITPEAREKAIEEIIRSQLGLTKYEI